MYVPHTHLHAWVGSRGAPKKQIVVGFHVGLGECIYLFWGKRYFVYIYICIEGERERERERETERERERPWLPALCTNGSYQEEGLYG